MGTQNRLSRTGPRSCPEPDNTGLKVELAMRSRAAL